MSADPSEFIALTATGVITGHIALIGVATSLMSRNWLEGVLLGAAGLLCVMIAAWLPNAMWMGGRLEYFLIFATLPAVSLIATLPLIFSRWFFGWHLSDPLAKPPARSRLSIEDMILVPSAIAAILVAAGQSSAFSDDPSMASNMMSLVFSIPALIVCGVIVLPSTYWFFRGTDLGSAWAGAGGYLLACTCALVLLAAVLSNGNLPPQALGMILGMMFIASLVGLTGLHIIRSSGYQWVRYNDALAADSSNRGEQNSGDLDAHSGTAKVSIKPSPETPFDLDAPDENTYPADRESKERRIRFRVAVGALVIVTAVLNIAVWTYAQNRLKRVLASIAADGGVIESLGDIVISIDFGPKNAGAHLMKLPPIDSLREIKLNRAIAPDLWQLRKFQGLQSVDLRGAEISPGMLRSAIPPQTTITLWRDQVNKAEADQLKATGYVLELIDR